MRVAVTGATGFIGRFVLRELAKRQHLEVVAASRAPPDDQLLPAGCRHVQLDIADAGDAFELLGRPEVLIHLAWSGLPNFKSLHHFETHLAEQYRFLSLLVTAGLGSLLCTGTCFEYGMRSGELSEELPGDPQNPYAFAKDALRRQLGFLRARSSFDLCWARLFYIYGDGQAPTSLYTQLMDAGRSSATSFKMSGGEQLRDFLPVTQVAAAIVALALHAPDAGIVNICSGRPVSVRSMVERWLRENNWSLQLELGAYPYPDYEPMAFWGSERRLRAILSACAAQ